MPVKTHYCTNIKISIILLKDAKSCLIALTGQRFYSVRLGFERNGENFCPEEFWSISPGCGHSGMEDDILSEDVAMRVKLKSRMWGNVGHSEKCKEGCQKCSSE